MSERRLNRSSALRSRLIRGCLSLAGLLLLAIAGGWLYLNRIGLPEFVIRRIQADLAKHDSDLRVGQVRLQGYRTLLARDLRLRMNQASGSEIALDRATVRLASALRDWRRLRPESIELTGGRVEWHFPSSNAAPAHLVFEKIAAQFEMPRDNRWQLTRLAGRFLNADFEISGVLTNGSAMARRLTTRTGRQINPEAQERLHQIATALNGIQLADGSIIALTFGADGSRTNSFSGTLQIQSLLAKTPSITSEKLQLTVALSPAPTPDSLVAELDLQFARLQHSTFEVNNGKATLKAAMMPGRWELSAAETRVEWERLASPWGKVHAALCTGKTTRFPGEGLKFSTAFEMRSSPIDSLWGRVEEASSQGEIVHALFNLDSVSGRWRLRANNLESSQGSLAEAQISGMFKREAASSSAEPLDGSAGWWTRLEPFQFDWKGEITRLNSPKIKIERAQISGDWSAPALHLRELQASLYGGSLDASANLDVRTRQLRSAGRLDFDVHQLSPLLTTNAQRWLRQFTWETPPSVTAEARLILPAWTNQAPNWMRDVLPTVELAGSFSGTNGAFRKVPVTAAHSHFAFTNSCWRLPDLIVTRPEGTARLDYWGDMRTQDFFWAVDARVNPKAARPLLDPPQQKALDLFEFPEPPHFRGEIWGRWHARERLGFRGRVIATNVLFRGEACDRFAGNVAFTNLLFELENIEIRRGEQQAAAPAANYDLETQLLYVNEATSTLDPNVVTKVIGPKVHAALKPYQFARPPTVRIAGYLPMSSEAEANVRFDVKGNDFAYWKFKLPEIAAELRWVGDTLSISNVQAGFYGGQAGGDGFFDFRARRGADLRFRTEIAGADLRRLAVDLMPATKQLEGTLNGHFVVTSANSNDEKSWRGFGDVTLHDGFLWEIPIFGFFSPMLNRIAPGLGSSRATAGSATFMMDRSVIHTSDLEIRSPALRLQYEGQVDLDGRVDARMQAEVLRDAWAIGRVLSLALWPITKVFEYKITGTLQEPTSEPLYIPKVLTWPFRPLRALRNFFSKEPDAGPFPKQSSPSEKRQ